MCQLFNHLVCPAVNGLERKKGVLVSHLSLGLNFLTHNFQIDHFYLKRNFAACFLWLPAAIFRHVAIIDFVEAKNLLRNAIDSERTSKVTEEAGLKKEAFVLTISTCKE